MGCARHHVPSSHRLLSRALAVCEERSRGVACAYGWIGSKGCTSREAKPLRCAAKSSVCQRLRGASVTEGRERRRGREGARVRSFATLHTLFVGTVAITKRTRREACWQRCGVRLASEAVSRAVARAQSWYRHRAITLKICVQRRTSLHFPSLEAESSSDQTHHVPPRSSPLPIPVSGDPTTSGASPYKSEMR